jgi:hypothetical protein
MNPPSSPWARATLPGRCAAALATLALIAIGSPKAMAATPDPAAATASPKDAKEAAEIVLIGKTLDLLHASAAKADGKTYFSLYAPGAVFMGTDVSERWTIEQFQAYAGPLFAQGTGWVYTVRQREVTIAPVACKCVAWFDEVLDSQKYGTSRGTGALVRGTAGWKITQYALTFPMPNDLAADFTQRIREYEKSGRK